MREPVIRIYEPGKKPTKFIPSTKDHPLIDEIASGENLFANSDQSSDTVLNNYLRGNPFLYNPKTDNVVVSSLEDFIIKAKKEEMAFGDVIRNPKFSPKQRKKIIKKAFISWKKEYTEKKNQTFKENDKVIEVIGDISYLEYTIKAKLLLIFIFILLLFLVVTDSALWELIKQKTFGYTIYMSITQMYGKMNWLKIVGNVGVYACLVLIFYSSIYSFIIKDFRKNYKLAQAFLTNSEVSISRDFKKKYNKAKRYYLKRINNKKYPFFPPLNIEEVQEGKMNITIFNEICKATIDRAYVVKKSKPYFSALNNILKFLGYGCAIIIVALSLYSIIINIFS